jgi:hypothetical protein
MTRLDGGPREIVEGGVHVDHLASRVSSNGPTGAPVGHLQYATPAYALKPWDGRPLDPPIHGIWARRAHRGECPLDV